MFQLTSRAAFTINEARRENEIPERFGVRLTGLRGPSGVGVQLSFVEEPSPSDIVAEMHGTHVFIAEELAGPLFDTTLDVEPAVADNGRTPATKLVLRPQNESDRT
jgi:Fe-S cluster assembly iron-binding protein IscA